MKTIIKLFSMLFSIFMLYSIIAMLNFHNVDAKYIWNGWLIILAIVFLTKGERL